MADEYKAFESKESRDQFLAHLEILEQFWLAPYEGRVVKTNYGDTFVRINGPKDAPPLVLLPGGQSNSLVWRRMIGSLSEHYRTYAIDAIYDQGRSVPCRPVKTIDDICQWLDETLDELELKKGITIAGQSYGSYVSAEYALHAPQRLQKIVLIAPVMIGAPISTAFVENLKPVADDKRESLEAFCRWIMPFVAANYPEEFNKRIDEILLVRECYGIMFAPVRAAVISDDDLRKITTPTLYILGEQDGATEDPHKAVERVTSLMPNVDTLLVPNAGHDVVASDTDMLTERVLSFI